MNATNRFMKFLILSSALVFGVGYMWIGSDNAPGWIWPSVTLPLIVNFTLLGIQLVKRP
ncbi:MAG: hypothetical protein PHY16_07805 [Methylobacter sp.]|nr:hypothetical protein [Methylobacter sp.]